MTASDTVPELLMATIQMRNGVLFEEPSVDPDGIVIDSAEVTSMTS